MVVDALVSAGRRVLVISCRLWLSFVVRGLVAVQVLPFSRSSRVGAVVPERSVGIAVEVALRWTRRRFEGLDISDLGEVREAWFAELDRGCRRLQIVSLDDHVKVLLCVVCS